MQLGSIETGGTKFVCAVGDENGKIFEQVKFPTTTPEETMKLALDWFSPKKIEAIGIACFGPIDLHHASPTYGSITTTPKPGWGNYNIVHTVKSALHVPVGFDTDVNGSLLGEVTWGSAKGLRDVIYITIGTGIGAGILTNGSPLHGMLHPEAGHIRIPKREDDTYEGGCPYHGTCFEGLASGPAIEKRWGCPAAELVDHPEVWDLEAYYIAEAISIYICTLSPQRIILGGGVMNQLQLFPMIRQKTAEMINGYIQTEEMKHLDTYIVPASLQDDQGIMGGLKLAYDAFLAEQNENSKSVQ